MHRFFGAYNEILHIVIAKSCVFFTKKKLINEVCERG
jgi:hypothetical protein